MHSSEHLMHFISYLKKRYRFSVVEIHSKLFLIHILFYPNFLFSIIAVFVKVCILELVLILGISTVAGSMVLVQK